MAGLTIHADGMDWPLETYLDARRFIRVDGEPPSFADAAGRVDVVTLAGELREGVELEGLSWHDVMAVAVPAGSMSLGLCHGCGLQIVPVFVRTNGKGQTIISQDICGECDAEPW